MAIKLNMQGIDHCIEAFQKWMEESILMTIKSIKFTIGQNQQAHLKIIVKLKILDYNWASDKILLFLKYY